MEPPPHDLVPLGLKCVSFYSDTTPVPQPRQRHGAVVRGGKVITRNYIPSESPIHDFKAAIRRAAREVMSEIDMLTPPIHLGVTFVFARPKYLDKTKFGDDRIPHSKSKCDVDNLVKGLMDACTGIVWKDDGQIATLWVEKYFSARKENPCVIVVAQEKPSILRGTHYGG